MAVTALQTGETSQPEQTNEAEKAQLARIAVVFFLHGGRGRRGSRLRERGVNGAEAQRHRNRSTRRLIVRLAPGQADGPLTTGYDLLRALPGPAG